MANNKGKEDFLENRESDVIDKGIGIKIRRVIAYVVLILITAMCIFWFWVLIVNSSRSKGELTKGFSLLLSTHLIENWKGLLAGGLVKPWRGLLNSFIVASCSAVLCTYFSTMTAYAIHTYDFKMKNFIFTFIIAIMTIPTQVSALGFLQLVGDMKLMNSFIPLIIPSIAAPAVFFYMKQYMDSTLPLSLIEAARIDGSNEFRTFNEIAIPLMKPAIAVQAIFTFVNSWNNYFTPALIINSPAKKTLPIMIAGLRSADFAKFNMGQVYVMILFSIAPVVIVYIFISKYIVQGIALGSVKG